MSTTVYDVITDRILDQLERGVVPWHRPWHGTPTSLTTGKEYRGINLILLGSSGYSTPYWLTYRQAQKLGGQVRKGEHSTPVVFWKWFDRDDTEHKPDTDPLVTKNGKPKGARAMLRYYRVFNADQCDGIPSDKVPAIQTREFTPIDAAEAIVEAMPQPPRINHYGTRACYNPHTDEVAMPRPDLFTGDAEYYSTLFHELTHSTGHDSRLGRHAKEHCTHHFGTNDYSKEELVAEFGAAFLCGHAGIEQRTVDNSASYIASWLRRLRNDKRLAVYAAAQAQKAADFVLGRKFGED